jgi:hypothetical protein
MVWEEPEDLRPRYRLCGAGFSLLALGLGLLCVDAALEFAFFCSGSQAIAALKGNPLWHWLVGAPITGATALGSLLLWGRWAEPLWQRRAGLLMLMNGVDLVHWTLHNGDALGLRVGPVPHAWLRGQLAQGMGWAELALAATLAADLSARLGQKNAADAARPARGLAVVGAIVWGLFFLQYTNWGRWPLRHRAFITPETFLLLIGSTLLLALASFQVTILCLSASRHCSRAVRELDRAAEARDQFHFPSGREPDDFWAAPNQESWR